MNRIAHVSAFIMIGAMNAAALAAGVDAAPSIQQVLKADQAASGGASLGAAVRNTYSFEGMGLKGKLSSLTDPRDGRYVDDLALGSGGAASGYDGAHAWVVDKSGAAGRRSLEERPRWAVNEAYRRANTWWRVDRGGAVIVSEGIRIGSGGSFDVLTVTPKGGGPFEAWFDTTTHFLARTIERRETETVTTSYLDYRSVAGLMQAQKIVVDDGSGSENVETMTLIQTDFSEVAPPSAFTRPKTLLARSKPATANAEP